MSGDSNRVIGTSSKRFKIATAFNFPPDLESLLTPR